MLFVAFFSYTSLIELTSSVLTVTGNSSDRIIVFVLSQFRECVLPRPESFPTDSYVLTLMYNFL